MSNRESGKSILIFDWNGGTGLTGYRNLYNILVLSSTILLPNTVRPNNITQDKKEVHTVDYIISGLDTDMTRTITGKNQVQVGS